MLVQKSPTSISSNKALEKFSELVGEPVTEGEENILIMCFPNHFRLLKTGRLNRDGAKKLFRLLKTTLKSLTLIKVMEKYHLFFGAAIGAGGGKSILQKVVSLKTGEIFCAKVFLDVTGTLGYYSANHDVDVSNMVQPHINIAPIAQSIEFSHASGDKLPLLALMMPMYHISLAELLSGFHQVDLSPEMFNHVAKGLLSAGARFQEKNLSHCDIKPENIMMDGLNPVLVDFGAVVNIGDAIREHTPFYSLEANKNAVTSEFDLFCIVTTLVRCVFSSFDLQNRTRLQMISLINQMCASNIKLEQYGAVCIVLLNCTSSKEGLEHLQQSLA